MPRTLHPVAWWIWALGLATAVSRTTNPLLLLLVLAVLGVVVANRRSDAPWARAFKYYLYLALTVVAIRVVFRSVFGGDIDAADMHVLFDLPHVPLPSWAAGVQLGGPVTLEGTLAALYDGLRLGCLLCCLGAANALANPKRALRVLPGALYELGVAVVVSLSVAPQLVESVQRVRRARKLRGGATGGFHALRSIAIPVLEDALERSLRLAAAMDSRGYGRTGGASARLDGRPGSSCSPACAGCASAPTDCSTARRPARSDSPPCSAGRFCAASAWSSAAVGWAAASTVPIPGRRRVDRRRLRRGPRRRLPGRGGCRRGRPQSVDRPAGLAVASRSCPRWPSWWPPWPRWPPRRRSGRRRSAADADAGAADGSAVRRIEHRAGSRPGRGSGVIEFDRVTVTYAEATTPVLRDVYLGHRRGRAGSGGRDGPAWASRRCSGPSTGWCRTSPAGPWPGGCLVDGRDTRTHPPRELADVVGVVGQDPLSGFVTDTVEEELAYAMEQLAVPPDVMRKRVEETLDLLGIADLRDRPLYQLSGGQQQRVAIGSVLTAHPRVLVLDEPTSALDPTAAEEVLAAITRLVHDLGVTVVLAEHRLERVVQYADRVIEVKADGTVATGPPAAMLRTTAGGAAGRRARPAGRLGSPAAVGARRPPAGRAPPGPDRPTPVPRSTAVDPRRADRDRAAVAQRRRPLRAGRRRARRGPRPRAGEVTALMGRNGSGKSSLLWALQGSGPRQSGTVDVDGADPAVAVGHKARRLVGLVPQTPADLLYLDTVAQECDQADRESAGAHRSGARALLDRLAPGIADEHPRDLSEGQRLALVLAVQLAAAPKVVLLDEPTRGLDYPAKRTLIDILDQLAAEGGRWSSPPTTSSSWPRPPIGWW